MQNDDEDQLPIEKKLEKEIEAKEREKHGKTNKKQNELDKYKIKENVYSTPIKKYLKFKQKKLYYSQMKDQSKIKYYLTVKSQIFIKLFRKKLFHIIVMAAIWSVGWYFYYKSGIHYLISYYIDNLCDKIIKFFSKIF
jgi:hypothetical protein